MAHILTVMIKVCGGCVFAHNLVYVYEIYKTYVDWVCTHTVDVRVRAQDDGVYYRVLTLDVYIRVNTNNYISIN